MQTNTSTNATVSSNAYNYDPAGNRLAETTASGTTAGQFNNLNQLIAYTGSTTSTTVAGHTSAPISSATVNAVPATITSSTNFTANVPLPAGTNVVSVVAQPISGAAATQREQIIATGAAPTALSYDANGNTLIDEKGYAYTWDALNRMISITYPSGASTLFAYDGLSRRISIIEKDSAGTVASTKNYLWIGSEIAEERDSSNTVQKRFFPQGEQQGSSNFYYTFDHLGSTREVCSSSGTILTRYSYDPYGRTTLVSGTDLASFQYAGMYNHQTSGFYLTEYRAYDPNTGRWLSRDPAGEIETSDDDDDDSVGGMNLYGYVSNDPLNYYDDDGLGKRPSRNRDRDGHRGGNNTTKHEKANRHGGREKGGSFVPKKKRGPDGTMQFCPLPSPAPLPAPQQPASPVPQMPAPSPEDNPTPTRYPSFDHIYLPAYNPYSPTIAPSTKVIIYGGGTTIFLLYAAVIIFG